MTEQFTFGDIWYPGKEYVGGPQGFIVTRFSCSWRLEGN
jgi:hypothetical protein